MNSTSIFCFFFFVCLYLANFLPLCRKSTVPRLPLLLFFLQNHLLTFISRTNNPLTGRSRIRWRPLWKKEEKEEEEEEEKEGGEDGFFKVGHLPPLVCTWEVGGDDMCNGRS